MRTKVIIIDGKRTDKPEYPVNALREAVANALIHRDYSFQTECSYISVNMYNDRVEIISPGALYGSNKLETIESGLKSETRNPTIIRLIEEKSDIIENRHTGIYTMKRLMKEHGLQEPEF